VVDLLGKKKSTKDLVHGGAEPIEVSPAGVEDPKEKKKKEKPVKEGRRGIIGIFRSKLFWGILSIIAGLVLAFVVSPMVQAKKAALAPVVVLTQNVAVGQQLTSEMLTIVEVGATGVPLGAIMDANAAVGQYITATGLAGDIVTTNRLASEYPTDDPALLALPEGKVAMAVALDSLEQSVASKLRAGDVIQLFAVLDSTTTEDEDLTALVIPELRAVEILSVTNSAAEEVADRSSLEDVEDRQIATVVLAVNQQQAATLAGLADHARLHAALVIRGDPEKKAAALTAQDDYFAELDSTLEGEPPEGGPGEEGGDLE